MRILYAAVATLALLAAAVDLARVDGYSLYYWRALVAGFHQPQPRCPACDSDEALRRHLLQEIPGLERLAREDPLAAALALRDWVAGTVHTGMSATAAQVEALRFRRGVKAYELFTVFDRGEGGTACSGAAQFLLQVLALFGIESTVYGFAVEGSPIRSHAVALVALPGPAGPRFYPVDPWYGRTLTDGTQPLDLRALASLAAGGRLAAVQAPPGRLSSRLVLLAREDLTDQQPALGRAKLAEMDCQPQRGAGKPAYACRTAEVVDFDKDFGAGPTPAASYARALLQAPLSVSSGLTPDSLRALCAQVPATPGCGVSRRSP
jgi:hypothetical protein